MCIKSYGNSLSLSAMPLAAADLLLHALHVEAPESLSVARGALCIITCNCSYHPTKGVPVSGSGYCQEYYMS